MLTLISVLLGVAIVLGGAYVATSIWVSKEMKDFTWDWDDDKNEN